MPDNRQPYPVGDIENGQWVQVRKQPLEEVDWLNYEDLTVSSTVLGLTYNDAGFDRAFITVETDSVRFRLDNGAPPSATSGQLAPVNTSIELEGVREIQDFRVVRVSSDATLRVHYGRVIRTAP